MTEQKATNVHWHAGTVTQQDRHTLLQQKGATLWFTGLSGSGKSTVAVALGTSMFIWSPVVMSAPSCSGTLSTDAKRVR